MAWVPQDGQNVRFYSKLQPDLVLAASLDSKFTCYVHQMANGDSPETTMFQVAMPAGVDYMFQLFLRNVPGQGDLKLNWTVQPNGDVLLQLNPAYQDSDESDYFSYDNLDPDPWIAINNYTHDLVVDVFGSESNEGSRVDAFPWNGGDNQWWRVVPV